MGQVFSVMYIFITLLSCLNSFPCLSNMVQYLQTDTALLYLLSLLFHQLLTRVDSEQQFVKAGPLTGPWLYRAEQMPINVSSQSS